MQHFQVKKEHLVAALAIAENDLLSANLERAATRLQRIRARRTIQIIKRRIETIDKICYLTNNEI